MDPAVVAALITGLVSLLVAVFSIWFTTHTQAKMAKENSARDKELLLLNASLTKQREEEAAQREYAHDAVKHVKPLLYHLSELCEESINRVRRIVNEEIEVRTTYHVLTTAQRLAGPLVVAQELQRQMTTVDPSVDPVVMTQYIVSRELLWNLHDGIGIAAAPPAIRAAEDAPEVPRQHLTSAQLQSFVDVFTIQGEDGTRRPLKITELEELRSKKSIAEVLARVGKLFELASPSSTPVLWRLLIAQASLMYVLVDLVNRNSATVHGVLPANIKDFAWHPGGDSPSFESQVDAVDAYLRMKLSRSGLHLA
jgi:hypothetical protein